MRFTFCPHCGSRLVEREIGDEGFIPYCEGCKKPLFDMFSTCIIALVENGTEDVLLLEQSYISNRYRNLVSGYMQPGERAEDAAVREILEETGLRVTGLSFVGTYWFQKKDMLMIGFIARTEGRELTLSKEVDGAEWTPAQTALTLVHPEGSVSYALVKAYLDGAFAPAISI